MSWDYRACFLLPNAVAPTVIERALEPFGVRCRWTESRLEYRKGKVLERPPAARDGSTPVEKSPEPAPPTVAWCEGDDFHFDFLGFVRLPCGLAAWLEIQDGPYDRMGSALYDLGFDPLHVFVALFVALGASTMAMGHETSARQFLSFFEGTLPEAEMDETICFAIAPHPASAAFLRKHPFARVVDVKGTQVFTRNLAWLDEYFR